MALGLVLCSSAPKSAIGSLTCGSAKPLGYGVIGNTADSGSAILGSSPGTPAQIICTTSDLVDVPR